MKAAKFTPEPWYWIEYHDYLGGPHYFVCRQTHSVREYLLTLTGKRREFRSALAAEIAVAKANKDSA